MNLNSALKSFGKFIKSAFLADSNNLFPIERMTPEQRMDVFNANEINFYSNPNFQTNAEFNRKADAYEPQPFVRVYLFDEQGMKYTEYDSVTNANNSVQRDKDRIGKFLRSFKGEEFLKSQVTFQKYNPFDETSVFDEDSVIRNTSRQDRYTFRHTPDTFNTGNISGTATEKLSNYVTVHGDAKYGLLRNKTGYNAFSVFRNVWTGGLYESPEWSENVNAEWKYRPEYQEGEDDVYQLMYDDSGELLVQKGAKPLRQTANSSTGTFYKDEKVIFEKLTPTDFQPNTRNENGEYTNDAEMQAKIEGTGGLMGLHTRMFSNLSNNDETYPTDKKSAERYNSLNDDSVTEDNNYNVINSIDKGQSEGPFLRYLRQSGGVVNEIQIDNRGFAKGRSKANPTGMGDTYNMLEPTADESDLYLNGNIDSNQSADLIFFYFYDLINEIYIPFRAILAGIQDQNTPSWEDVKYMGRADTLYIYKGYTRNVSFNFKVVANSIDELIPMWKRINYLVGLTRPSKYTGTATVTNTSTDGSTTGRESGFIYPPMITFRIGDLYVEQPGVLTSVNVSIPEEATWETLRDDDYKYVYGSTDDKVLLRQGSKSRQLPNMVDVSVQLNIIERKQSITNENHFGPLEHSMDGWQLKVVEDIENQDGRIINNVDSEDGPIVEEDLVPEEPVPTP